MMIDEELIEKKETSACCHSYQTSRGRCYDCPDDGCEFSEEE